MAADATVGHDIHQLLGRLFPICRSITGNGLRQTLRILQEVIPLQLFEVPTGTAALDWTVPREWNIRGAYLANEKGDTIVDFARHNLHVVGYSVPVDVHLPLADLQAHLHSLPDQPDAIPYITSYYQENWGFCLPHRQRAALPDGIYHAVIDSDLNPGALTYGECLVPGELDREVFLSTYVCHPSMANNELSGPGVTAFLVKWLLSAPRRYTYRIVFVPETIGAIVYLSRHLETLKEKVIAGFNVTCVGDDRAYSMLRSRQGTTQADRVARNVLTFRRHPYTEYSFLDRGSDESHYCSPGVDLPLVSIMRSKYGTYPEYHTSLDDLTVVTPRGLQGGFEVLQQCVEAIERNEFYRVTCCAEPQLGKRGLYPMLSTKTSAASMRDMRNLLAYADGTRDLIDISTTIGVPLWELYPMVDTLTGVQLLAVEPQPAADRR